MQPASRLSTRDLRLHRSHLYEERKLQWANRLPSNSADVVAPEKMSGLKRATIVVIKGIGIIAALGFWFFPVTRYPGILWFGASIVVGLLCIAALSWLDEGFTTKYGKEGYWPKPLDWNKSPKDSTDDRPTKSRLD
jgi:hypothetical protein